MSAPLLRVEQLVKTFAVPQGLWRAPRLLRAVDGIDLTVGRGEIVGLVGESGSGKTTAGRTILRLYEPDAGSVQFDGIDLRGLSGRAMRQLRRRMQIVFQDPGAALNPRMRIGALVGEPLLVHKLARGEQLRARVLELLGEVGIEADAFDRYPHEFSGGQKQRIFIARALSVRPDFVVLDEPVTALDVSVQAQIVNLLVALQQKHGIAYLFIAHDLALVTHLCERIAVMYLGRIVEQGPRTRIVATPAHPYTRALFAAAPPPEPALARLVRAPLPGEIPSALEVPAGCRFHTRCPLAVERCRHEDPPVRTLAPGHLVACHRTDDVLAGPWPPTGQPPHSTTGLGAGA